MKNVFIKHKTVLLGAVSNVLSSASVAVNDNKWTIPSNLWTMNVAMKGKIQLLCN